jgi:hypothetical protein
VAGGTLIVKNEEGYKSHTIPAGFKFLVDGEVGLEQLSPGMLTATIVSKSTKVVTESEIMGVAALSPAAPPAARRRPRLAARPGRGRPGPRPNSEPEAPTRRPRSWRSAARCAPSRASACSFRRPARIPGFRWPPSRPPSLIRQAPSGARPEERREYETQIHGPRECRASSCSPFPAAAADKAPEPKKLAERPDHHGTSRGSTPPSATSPSRDRRKFRDLVASEDVSASTAEGRRRSDDQVHRVARRPDREAGEMSSAAVTGGWA